MSIDFLYDEESGLYGELQTAIGTPTSVAIIVDSATGRWTGSSMYIESLDMSFDATGVATASLSLTGTVTFAAQA